MDNNLLKLVRFARKQGLKRLKCGEIEFEFSSPPELKARRQPSVGDPLSSDIEEPGPDEMLYWSSPHFDLLKADRAKAKEPNGL
jgi:hypothetical protein